MTYETHLKTYWRYSKLPKWRQRLHRFVHLIGLNRCLAIPGGYRCTTCGETRRYFKEN